MNILLSLITSGSIKWLSILILALGLGIAIFKIHINSIDAERQKALQESIIAQLQQSVKDKERQLEQMKEIYDKRNEYVNKLINERSEMENKLKQIEIDLAKKNDAPASNILKDLFKSLGEKK